MHDPSAPRNRIDLSQEEDARVTINTGAWVSEGFADYVAFEVAAKLHVVPIDLFDEGKTQGEVAAHARKWLSDPRGRAVLPFIGSHGSPEGAMADRENVAAPYYVLGHSFVNYLVGRFGRLATLRLSEQQANGVAAIEDDFRVVYGVDLVTVRRDWLTELNP